MPHYSKLGQLPAKQHIQFGRAIGSFQAVKHRCAVDLLEIESAASQATELVTQMLAYAGRAKVEKCAVDLAAVVSEVRTLISSSIGGSFVKNSALA